MFSRSFFTRAAAAVIILALAAILSAEELRVDHVAATFPRILKEKEYVHAIARTVSSARREAIERLNFDMPEIIHLKITLDPEKPLRLFTNGQDGIFLEIRSEEDLRLPQIYGMCHEVGHIAMYRLTGGPRQFSHEGAEGWAHYLGSRLVDGVYAREGADLWPQRYDYREDGTRRLEWQLAAENPSGVEKGAAAWKQLAKIVGDKNIVPLFRAWGQINCDRVGQGNELGHVLGAVSGKKTRFWWNKNKDLLVKKIPRSTFTPKTIALNKLSGRPQELVCDDGVPAGKRSIAGSGHAVRFEAPGDSFYLTGIRIYGSRYGTPIPPPDHFQMWLCDQDFKVISNYTFPYSFFPWGDPQWIVLEITPIKVPRDFIVGVNFQPTANKGVYVFYDGKGSGHSLMNIPGDEKKVFPEGDWMIRAGVDKRR